MRHSTRVLWLALLPLLLSGCDRSGPYADLRQYLDKIKEQQNGVARSRKVDIIFPQPVIYAGNMRRSPFAQNELLASPAKSTVTNPLQAYSLTMLRLLGTVTEKGATFAYITTPDNMVYRIQVGDIIGDRHGKVVNIQPGSVSVMELDSDNPDQQMQRVVSLKLRSDAP